MQNTESGQSRRYFWFAGATLGVFLLIFIVAEALGFDLSGVAGQMEEMQLPLAAMAGVGMLLADIFLPTPSSLVMIANGTLFGWLIGTLLSLVGSMGATFLGYAVGKGGSGKAERWMGRAAMDYGKKLLARHGMLAIMVTRPVPLLAETVAVVAGTSGLSIRKVFWGSLAGLLPTTLLYAWAGDNLATDALGIWPFLTVFGLASVFFLIGYFKHKPTQSKNPS